MFGFPKPESNDLNYRRRYARCCQHLRQNFGLSSLPILSYEAVLLYIAATEGNEEINRQLPDVACCRLRSASALRYAPDVNVGRFCSALSVLLASIKLEDDVRDAGSWRAKLGGWLLQKQLRKAHEYFSSLDDGFSQVVRGLIDRHLDMESRNATISLAEYCQPTAEAFGYVLGLIAKVPGVSLSHATLVKLGREIGSAIVSFDCGMDWYRDRKSGAFNPLPSPGSSETSVTTPLPSSSFKALTGNTT